MSDQSAAVAAPHIVASSRSGKARENIRLVVQKARNVFKSEASTLIIGCGQKGHSKMVSRTALEDHRHQERGAKTLDIDPGNSPDVVADITMEGLVLHEAYAAAIGPDQKFAKVKFEKVPTHLFDSPEKCDRIVQNVVAVSAVPSTVTIISGNESAEWMDNMAPSLETAGFVIAKRDPAAGKLKAERKS